LKRKRKGGLGLLRAEQGQSVGVVGGKKGRFSRNQVSRSARMWGASWCQEEPGGTVSIHPGEWGPLQAVREAEMVGAGPVGQEDE